MKIVWIRGREEMSRTIPVYAGARFILLITILTLFWAATAQAQEGPADDEYGNRADIPAVAASDSGGASVVASDSGSASASSGVFGSLPLLPSTGGASLFALGVGVLLAGAGLIVRKTIR